MKSNCGLQLTLTLTKWGTTHKGKAEIYRIACQILGYVVRKSKTVKTYDMLRRRHEVQYKAVKKYGLTWHNIVLRRILNGERPLQVQT